MCAICVHGFNITLLLPTGIEMSEDTFNKIRESDFSHLITISTHEHIAVKMAMSQFGGWSSEKAPVHTCKLALSPLVGDRLNDGDIECVCQPPWTTHRGVCGLIVHVDIQLTGGGRILSRYKQECIIETWNCVVTDILGQDIINQDIRHEYKSSVNTRLLSSDYHVFVRDFSKFKDKRLLYDLFDKLKIYTMAIASLNGNSAVLNRVQKEQFRISNLFKQYLKESNMYTLEYVVYVDMLGQANRSRTGSGDKMVLLRANATSDMTSRLTSLTQGKCDPNNVYANCKSNCGGQYELGNILTYFVIIVITLAR